MYRSILFVPSPFRYCCVLLFCYVHILNIQVMNLGCHFEYSRVLSLKEIIPESQEGGAE
jgi:hypothetical protein